VTPSLVEKESDDAVTGSPRDSGYEYEILPA
jgi:hypothetical protein